MDFKQLASFAAVVRTGSFSRAADVLYVSQPGISAHIALLEKELGTALFERGKKPLLLTDAGRELYDYAETVLKLKERMASVGKTAHRHTIRIGASTIPSAYYLPDLLCRYRRAHPETAFQITRTDSEKTIRGLREGLFDIAFTGMASGEPGIRFFPVAEDRMVLIAADTPEYRALSGKPDAIRTLLLKPLILREEGSASGAKLKDLARSFGLDADKLDIAVRTDDTEAIKSMAAGGLGVACISEKAVRDTAASRPLLVFALPDAFSVRQLYLLKAETAPLRPAAADFARFVLQEEQAP